MAEQEAERQRAREVHEMEICELTSEYDNKLKAADSRVCLRPTQYCAIS